MKHEPGHGMAPWLTQPGTFLLAWQPADSDDVTILAGLSSVDITEDETFNAVTFGGKIRQLQPSTYRLACKLHGITSRVVR